MNQTLHLHSIRQPQSARTAKIIVPYTNLRPVLRDVLTKVYGLEPQFVHLPEADSYWNLFRELWKKRETVVIIEHDVLPWPGAIEELLGCPSIWCSLSYKLANFRGHCGYGIHHAFGCTKITGEFMQLTSDLWDEMVNRDWHFLDSQLCDAAMKCGLVPHPHRPAAIHLKGCCDG